MTLSSNSICQSEAIVAEYKLIKIRHNRCQEWDCTTYVVAPAAWSNEEISQRLWNAQDAYMEAVKTARAGRVPPNDWTYGQPKYEDYPDKTVAEVKAEWDAKGEVHKAWSAEQAKTGQAFETFLTKAGFLGLYADDIALELDCDWGHNHGVPLKYEETKTDTLPTPAKFIGVASDWDDDDFA